MNPHNYTRDWDERTSAREVSMSNNGDMFQQLFERSADAIFLFDPAREVFVDCNQAAVEMMRATSKEQLLLQHPAELSPEFQPDGKTSRDKTPEVINIALAKGSHRFEWTAQGIDGSVFPLEVLLTTIQNGEQPLMATVCREITERKRTELQLLELNASLERRVNERTAALQTSEARLRAVVEHAPEAIVVFDGNTGRFLFGNEHASRLYGVSMEKLTALTPADVSPEFQSDGRRSTELARELMDKALRGEKPVFEWIHKQPGGRLIPTEVRLLPLPAEGRNLIRASIIDNSERKKAERALRESEAKFRALFEGASQGVVLHDENQILEVNPAAVRILGRQFAHEIIGRHPGEFSPPTQPGGENTDSLARKYIEECLATGSARFEWLASDPQGRGIPMEVYLTRIEWSGRQVIQAFITDISERKRAAAALAESEERFSAAFRATPVSMTISRLNDGRYVLANQAFLDWTGYQLDEVLGRDSLELGLWADPAERAPFWEELRAKKFIHGREVRVRHRQGKILTLLLSADIIEIQCVPHLLTVGLDISARKQAEAELRAGEAKLRESEALFSAAFNGSPILIVIGRMSDQKYVLVNDAFVNWSGFAREEILGRDSTEFGIWESQKERDDIWTDLRRAGSVSERECCFRNRKGQRTTMLVSFEVIQINHAPHVLAMGIDITGRKQAEAELRESEGRFSAAFQASPIFIGILRTSDGKFVLVNDALVDWLGRPREQALGQTCAALGMWENVADRASVWEELAAVGRIRQKECRWRNSRGELFTILLSADMITLSHTPHVLLLALDITQRKQAEVEILKTLAREKELSQLKSNFVSMVSHEFRTPLGIIQSSAELLRDFHGRMPPAEREEQLESIIRNTRRMAGMMEGVLALSRLDAGKLDFHPAALDLNLFCRRVVDEVLSATNRRCLIELTADVPPEAQADEQLLGHIFTNLLSNAVKYSEPGTIARFTVERDGQDAVCIFSDRGIGISAEDQQLLFKAFNRGSNVGARPGTGLGLLLVKRCAELHGGQVRIESKVGEGTTVTVRLPVFRKEP
jgi:PAS domain S-box-containing protein